MPTEKVTVEEAVQKLSEVSNNNNTRLADVESQLKQIQWPQKLLIRFRF